MKKNKTVKILLFILIASSLVLFALLYSVMKKQKEMQGETGSQLENYQQSYLEHLTDNKNIDSVVHDSLFTWTKPIEIYTVETQTAAREQIDAWIAQNEYTQDDMLLIYNPFCTNTQSMYVYFETEVPMRVSYRISVQEDPVLTYTANCYSEEEYATTHEYLLLGLMPDRQNRITITLTDEQGNMYARTFYYDMPSLLGTEKEQLTIIEGTSTAPLSNGLYVHLGNDSSEQDFMYFYDNEGILRGEVPIIGYRSHRLLFDDDMMYFSISERRIAKMDRFGQVHAVYKLDGYKLHHDYVLDDYGNLLVLATNTEADTVQDRVLCLDTKTGEAREVLDLSHLLKEYLDLCTPDKKEPLDWAHVNTIQWLGDGQILLSLREASAIIKVEDIYEIPVLEYIMADPLIFEGSGYESDMLTKQGSFDSHMGQHTVTYVKEKNQARGMYYVYMFNNNIGVMNSRPDFDVQSISDELGTTLKKGTTSYYYCYLVNESAKTYELVDIFAVPYSGYVSSVQQYDGHLIVDVGGRFKYYEYDENKELIRGFRSAGEDYIYRVYKYDFKGFYFN